MFWSVTLETVEVIALTFAFFTSVTFLFCGGFYLYFWVWRKDAMRHKRVQQQPRHVAQPGIEIKLTLLNSVVFSVTIGGISLLTEAGLTKVYFDISEHGWGYFALTFVILIIAHDVWHYFMHRAMHDSSWLFRHIHYVHHKFTNPTPFASYALHPVETLAELAVIGALLLIIPIHPGALACYIVFLTYLNAISHLGYEFYPSGVSRWFITSTHHNLHHDRFNGQYMLYFPILDDLFGSTYPDCHELYEKLVHAKPGTPSAAEPPEHARAR